MQYDIDIFDKTPERLLRTLATACRQRRLDRGLSRRSLAEQTGIPAPTLAKFEKTGKISLESFARIAIFFGYFDETARLLERSKYTTSAELETINRNHDRQRGR